MRRKKNRAEVWAGRGRHLYIVQAVALTVVPDTALHPRRKRESNMNFGSYAPFFLQTTPKMTWHRNCFSFWFHWSFAICVYGFRGHLCGPSYSGNSRPTRTCASGPDQMAGKGGGVEGQEAPPTVDTICSFLLTTYLWCLKAELPRQWYKLTTNYFYYDSFFFTYFIFPGFWNSLAMQSWLTLKSM